MKYFKIDSEGTKWWYLNENLHRDDDLPAIEFTNGSKVWYNNGSRHRDNDEPAVEYFGFGKEWWVHGKCHRIKGPAIEYVDDSKYWYINGKLIDCHSQKEFEKHLMLLTFE